MIADSRLRVLQAKPVIAIETVIYHLKLMILAYFSIQTLNGHFHKWSSAARLSHIRGI